MQGEHLIDLFAWGGMLILVAYTTGTLHERHRMRMAELRRTYEGLLVILRQFISKDKYTENHSYRVSVYSATIATYLGLPMRRIEVVRAAALLHDIGKLDISRELLHKASSLNSEEMREVDSHVEGGAEFLGPVSGPLGEIIPIILAHHDKFDGSGHPPRAGETIPVEARIIAVADVYDALTSDRPYRKAMPPYEVKEMIVKGAGTDYDPQVVRAFVEAYQKGALEVPEILI